MANVNSIARLASGPNAKDMASLVLGASTTETAFLTNGLTVAGTTVIAPAAAILSLPDIGVVPSQYDSSTNVGRRFRITLQGFAVSAGANNLTLRLYQVPSAIVRAGTGATLANDAVLFASTARAIDTSTAIYNAEAEFAWNSVSRIIQGRWTDTINNITDAWAATTAVTTAAPPAAAVPVGQLTQRADQELNFIVSVQKSAGTAGDIVALTEIAIELI